MPNTDVVKQAISSAGKFCPSATLTNATSEAQFTDSGGTNPMVLWIPGSKAIANRPVIIRAWGRLNTAGSYNNTVAIYVGTSATIGSNSVLATSGTVAASGKGNWLFEVRGIWDSDSTFFLGDFNGYFAGTSAATIKGQTILGTLNQPATATTSEAIGLTITYLVGTSNAANTAILDGFELEVK